MRFPSLLPSTTTPWQHSEPRAEPYPAAVVPPWPPRPQAFIKAVLQARGDLVYRFHKTDIVIVRANGDIKLTTGGWYTATTMASMNDVLSEVHIQV